MELFKASNQWATRPQDERFDSIQALYDQTRAYADIAREKVVPYSSLRVEACGSDVCLVGKAGVPAQLTNWAFGQLATKVEAPASYLRQLPPTLAAQNLNHGLAKRANQDDTAALMFHSNGSLLLRCIASEQYSRIWNWEIAERLLDWETRGWKPAMPTIRKTENDRPALYASDHDLFAFVVNPSIRLKEVGNDEGLIKGVFVENSEVGAKALKMTRFYFRAICGNFIVWGAQDVQEIKVRHVGDVRERFQSFSYELTKYANESVSDDEAIIASAQSKVIASTKEGVLDVLFGKRSIGLSRKALEGGYDATLPDVDGPPNTVWGMMQGLTRYSQTVPFADGRVAIDRAAGKLMELVF